jgi:Tol biopolymer transport system component
MRRFARLLGLFVVALVFAASGSAARSLASPGSFRLLYVSDWSGTSQIYAADPLGTRPTAQVSFGRAPTCGQAACGYADAVPSPNGRFVLFSDWASCDSSHPSSLFLARADGTHRRVLARAHSTISCPRGLNGAWAPDSTRIAYAVDGRIYTVGLDGGPNRSVGRGDRFSWAPHGRSIAFSALNPSGGYGPLSVLRHRRTRVVAAVASDFAWSPDGRRLAYSFVPAPGGPAELDTVRPDGTGRRSLLTGYFLDPKWSADGRFLSVWTPGGIAVITLADGARRQLGFSNALAWQPHGHGLAVASSTGTYVFDAATGAARPLTSDVANDGAWSPDGELLAYTTRADVGTDVNEDIRVATPAGTTRTLVTAAGQYGGGLSGFAWTRVPPGAHYRHAQPRVLAVLGDNQLTAPWPVTRLAADGEHVAYVSCGHVFVWTPAAKTVVQTEPNSSFSPRCTTPNEYYAFWLYTLALSGDRIAYGDLTGNMGQTWGLYSGLIDKGASFVSLDRAYSANGCAVGSGGLGDLVGAGGLLAYSRWRDDFACPATTLEQEIHRVDPDGCPCPVVATSPGPLVPFDADAGRIVAGGTNATVVLDTSGAQLMSVPVSPLAAQLSGSDLVVLVRGRLLVYDAATGARLHDWPLPDVPSGGECGSPHTGTWECRTAALLLEDAARGLATYVLDGQLHILRLSDGADRLIGAASLARFMDAGLVYADGARIRLVPFAQLALQ